MSTLFNYAILADSHDPSEPQSLDHMGNKLTERVEGKKTNRKTEKQKSREREKMRCKEGKQTLKMKKKISCDKETMKPKEK